MLFAAAFILAYLAAMISRPLIALAYAKPNLCHLSRAISWRGRSAFPRVAWQARQLHDGAEAPSPDEASLLASQRIAAPGGDGSCATLRVELGSAETDRLLQAVNSHDGLPTTSATTNVILPSESSDGNAKHVDVANPALDNTVARAQPDQEVEKERKGKCRTAKSRRTRRIMRETLFEESAASTEASDTADSPDGPEADLTQLSLTVESRAELKGFGMGDNLGTLMRVIASIMRTRDMNRVRIYRDAIALHPQPRSANILFRCLLASCERASDLPVALQLVDDLNKAGVGLCEATALPLVRCYSDADNFQEAFALVKQVTALGEGKTRIVHPLLEGLFRTKQLDFMFEVFDHMHASTIIPRDIQLALALQLYFMQRDVVPQSRQVWLEKLVECLTRVAKQTNGLPLKILQQLSAQANGQSLQQVLDHGILAQNQQDLLGAIVDTSELQATGYLHAWNASYDLQADEAFSKDPFTASVLGLDITRSPRTATSSSSTSSASSTTTSMEVPPDFIDSSSPPSPPPLLFAPIIAPQRSDQNISFELARFQIADCIPTPSPPSSSSSASSSSQLSNARLVYIPSLITRCPHCQGHVDDVRMTTAEMDSMREAIFAQIRTVPNQMENMNIFIRWLGRQKPFDYIIDGANVAYSNQNFYDGRFTYEQLALVVNQLESCGKRVLVVLPCCYAPNTLQHIPNSIRTDRRQFYTIQPEDLAFLDGLRRRNALYAVPNGADDDWYWMMASLVSTNHKPSLVVSNDNLRDHRLSFTAPLPFLRWKASHLVYHSFLFEPVDPSSLAKEGDKTAEGKLEPPLIPIMTSNQANGGKNKGMMSAKTAMQSQSTGHRQANTMGKPCKVVLNSPTSFIREIQHEKSINRWHIPASDREVWLCINLD